MFTATELLRLVEAIYAGVLDASAWEAAIVGFCRAFGGEAAALPLQDVRSKSVQSITFVDTTRSFGAATPISRSSRTCAAPFARSPTTLRWGP